MHNCLSSNEYYDNYIDGDHDVWLYSMGLVLSACGWLRERGDTVRLAA